MSYPNKIKARRKIDALTGIKSSLEKIRSVIALTYLMYVANKRNSFVKYSVSDGNRIKIEPNLLKNIESLINKEDLSDLVNNNPLIVNQYEPLYVGVSLLMKLGYLKMDGKPNTAERTGGNRYPKQLYFATNIIILDLILSGFSEDERFSALYEWLQNKKSTNYEFETKICTFLTTCTIFTQFKLRDNDNNEIFFQTEGIYSALSESKDGVEYSDSHEFVGPTRIFNNILREELEPWIKINKGLLSYTDNKIPIGFLSMGDIISNTLDIYNVNNDSTDLDNNDETNEDIFKSSNDEQPRQQIFYGAPGTGKSHGIKESLEELKVPKENVFRTTFHPDSDYSSFVGAYKPTMKKQYRYDGKVKAKYYEDDDLADAKKDDVIVDKVIQYDFIPQTFVKAYVRAYQTTENVYLIIEEINRGNCAQIFGDLFQLLDRDKNGFSEYTIKSDADLRTYLEDALGKDADGIKDGELCLPSNLYIWATMNTSDQSLFPIDSAFKRRWDWKYEPIKYENTNWKIEIGGTKYLWTDFQKTVNNKIFADTSSEDKMLGDYFVNPPTGIISEDLFLNKILFYLWNDVCKDGDGDIFKTEDNKDVKFSDLYGENGTTILLSMMRHLKVDPIDGTSDDNDEEEENEAEGSTPKRYSINGEVTNKDGKKWGKGTLVKRAVEIYCEKHPSETAEQIRNTWMSLRFKIPHLIETKADKEKRLTDSRDKTGRERAREIILSNGESIYVSTEVGSGAMLDGFGDFLTKIQSKPEWGISIQEL